MKKLFTNLKVFMTLCLLLVSFGNAWGETTYKLVTSTSDLKAGCKYIIGNGTSNSVTFMSNAENANNRKTTSATVSESKVTATEDILVLELGGSTDAWTLKTTNYKGTNGYLASASSGKSNYCRVITTETTATISFNTAGDVIINLQPHTERTLLRYNGSNNSTLFACYSSGQSAIYLYKEDTATPSTDATATFTLNGESIDFTNNSFTKNVAWNADDAGGYSVAITPATGATVTDVDGASGDASPYTIAAPTAGSTSTAMFEITAEDGNTTETYTISIVKGIKPTETYTVTFNAGTNGTCETTSLEEESAGAGVELPSCTAKTGYAFLGWSTTSDATEADAGEANATYYPTKDITLYAVYKEVYTITWSVNGTPTTDGNPTTSVVEGEGITALPTAPASISGMSFQGWTATQIETPSATAPTDLFTDAEHAPEITDNITFYAVFAEESEGDVTWTEITAVPEAGTYAILTEDYFMKAEISSSRFANGSEPEISNNKLTTAPAEDCIWEISKLDTYYRIKNGSNYAGGTNSKNQGALLTDANADLAKWTIEYNNGFTIVNYGRSIATSDSNNKYLKNNGTNGWATYASGTGSAPRLFKKIGSIEFSNYCTTVVEKQLTSITLDGEYPTEFWKGETFSHEGMTVTAHYSNAPDADVTSKAEFTDYDMSTAGNQTVTVTYDTKSTTYDITVKSIANTQETAYTVAEAKAIIDANPAELATTEVYVKGKVSEIVTELSDQYGNISFNVSADGETTGNQFQFYRNFKGADKEKWASAADVPGVGEDVIGLGKLTKYNNTTYEFAEGNYIVSRSRDIKISDVGYATAYVPFAATVTGATAYYVTVEGSSAKLHEIEGTIPANTGVVLKGAAGTAKFTESKDAPATVTGNVLKGTLEAKTQAELGETEIKLIYVLNEVDGKVGFYHLDGTLAANRAYMEVAVGVGVKAFFFDEEATGIQNSQFTIHNSDVMYNLNGQVVGKDYKGIVIVNGKKMLNK